MKLGRANVDALLRSLTAKQFVGWECYARLEPFDEIRADYRAARIAQVIANVNRGKDTNAYTDESFLLRYKEDDDEPDLVDSHGHARFDVEQQVVKEPMREKDPEQLHKMMMMMFGVQATDLPLAVVET